MDHLEFITIISQSWDTNDLPHVIPAFWETLLHWSNHVIGSIFGTKNRIISRLTGIQNSSKYASSAFLQNLECSLKRILTISLIRKKTIKNALLY